MLSGPAAASHGRSRRPGAHSANSLAASVTIELYIRPVSSRLPAKNENVPNAGARKFSGPDGYLVYVVKAEVMHRCGPSEAHAGRYDRSTYTVSTCARRVVLKTKKQTTELVDFEFNDATAMRPRSVWCLVGA